jgi:hypothetical protein
VVTAASTQDRDAAKPLLWNLRRAFPGVKLTWADGGYAGKLLTWAATALRMTLEGSVALANRCAWRSALTSMTGSQMATTSWSNAAATRWWAGTSVASS